MAAAAIIGLSQPVEGKQHGRLQGMPGVCRRSEEEVLADVAIARGCSSMGWRARNALSRVNVVAAMRHSVSRCRMRDTWPKGGASLGHRPPCGDLALAAGCSPGAVPGGTSAMPRVMRAVRRSLSGCACIGVKHPLRPAANPDRLVGRA